MLVKDGILWVLKENSFVLFAFPPSAGEFPLYELSEDVLLFPAEPEQETMVMTY